MGLQMDESMGMRLPRNEPTSAMSMCLSFLWHKCHFDAEGLPDKFDIHRRDSKTLTIGTRSDPNRTTLPAHSASSSNGPDVEEVLEREERAIADLALYIASGNELNSLVSLGPGINACPTRYIGVMKPIHLYFWN